MITCERDNAQTVCKVVKADLASRVKTSWSEACVACNVTLAKVIQELEAMAELHCGAVKEVWDNDNGETTKTTKTTKTMHQDNDNNNV